MSRSQKQMIHTQRVKEYWHKILSQKSEKRECDIYAEFLDKGSSSIGEIPYELSKQITRDGCIYTSIF